MNKFKKYCPNVWIAECEEKYTKGDIIQLETKYGKEVECLVYNLIASKNDVFYYSIERIEDQSYAERKADKYKTASDKNEALAKKRFNSDNFNSVRGLQGEPIKIGHHSEGRHRRLLEKADNDVRKGVEHYNKAEEQRKKAEYWESKSNDINLSMPDSIEYFEYKLQQAKDHHIGLKNGTIPKEHSYSMAYANKNVKELTKKYEIAKVLWGVYE